MKRLLATALVLSLALTLAACAPKGQTELRISAAVSLTDVLSELGAVYAQTHPDIKPVFNFDSSGTLQAQIEAGAPCDIFLSAAQTQMDALEAAGLLVEGTRVNLLENRVVLIRPADRPSAARSFEDVATAAVGTIALGEASVPVGQYAAEIFTHLGLWDAIASKAVFGSNVRAVLSWVDAGEVDCGVVYATDAALGDRVTVLCDAPEGSLPPVLYPAALVQTGTTSDVPGAFLEFLQSPAAAAVFTAAGFQMATR